MAFRNFWKFSSFLRFLFCFGDRRTGGARAFFLLDGDNKEGTAAAATDGDDVTPVDADLGVTEAETEGDGSDVMAPRCLTRLLLLADLAFGVAGLR